MKIGSHNSVTCYKGKGIVSKLVTIFSRCQSKKLDEQYIAGVRLFDIRVKYDFKTNKYIGAHGLWKCNLTLEDILDIINNISTEQSKSDVMITLEKGKVTDEFINYINTLKVNYKFIDIVDINQKKPQWKTVVAFKRIKLHQCYVNLDGSTWHTYIPIPWLWNKLYNFNTVEDAYNIYDFI